MSDRITRSDAEWRAMLTPETYRITRLGGTERPFSHPGFPDGQGRFTCACCGAALFDGQAKFDSHCGWPSFDRSAGRIDEHRDTSHGMIRTEVRCARCDAHLGHVFPDGPTETGLRYCINGVALAFQPGAVRDAAGGDEADRSA